MGAWPKYRSGIDRPVGETQVALLAEAADKDNGQVMADPQTQNARWCAMKRMVQRGLFERYAFGSEVIGVITVYQITDAGRAKLKKVKEMNK